VRNGVAILGTLLTALSVSAADSQLKYVVILTRHGVRSPTWDAAQLHQYSAEPWPDWGVPPGNLTPHGRQAILIMGAYYRDWLSSEHLLNPKGCESAGKITIYADKDQRTIETGRALAEALVPGCGLSTGFGHGTKEDPLFSETFTSDLEVALKAVSIRFDSKLRAQHQAAFEAVQYILGVVLTAKSIALKGSFASGSTLGENFQLEYTNGMKGKDLGWGRLTRENLFRIMEFTPSIPI